MTRTDTIAASWNALTGCYVAPESEQVLGLMGPVRSAAGDVNDTYVAVAGKLDTYADELDAIKPRLADFEQRVADFRAEVKDGVTTSLVGEVDAEWWSSGLTIAAWGISKLTDGMATVPWYEHDPTIKKNNRLWAEFADFIEQITASVATCANAINRLADPLACSVPYEAIPAEAITSGAVPNWGGPRAEERNCIEQVSDGTAEFTSGIAQGVGGLLLGYDPATGDFFTGTGYGQSWGGLGNLAMSLVLVPTAGLVAAPMVLAGENNAFTDFIGERAIVLRDVGASLISYDPYAPDGDGWHLWKEEGWKQGTSTLLNAGTFFIPTAGAAGASVKGAKASQVARFTAAAADMIVDGGSWAVKGAIGAGKGAGALLKGHGWAAAMDAARITTGGARITGTGGLTTNSLQAINDLTKTEPPNVAHPPNLPRVTDSLTPPVRPHNTGPGANIPGVGLTDDAIREGTNSWVNQTPPTDIVDTTGGHGAGDSNSVADGGGGATGSAPGAVAMGHPLPDIADLAHLKHSGQIDEWAKAVAERHPTLTADEVTAIYEYTTSPGDRASTNYDEMNSYLRDPSKFTPKQQAYIQSRIDLAVSGMSKLEPVPGRQFRGTDLPQPVLDSWQVGATVRDDAFSSSSLDAVVANRFRGSGNALIEVKGLTGVDVNPLSRYEGSEAEVLFRPGAQFTVLEREWVPSGRYWKFTIEEVTS